MRTQQESNAINRVLKSWGLGSLNEPGIVETFARAVDNHDHLTKLLRACEPQLRRDMYQAMKPHLRFTAKPLEEYVIAAKEAAEAAQLPRMDAEGNLLPYAYITASIMTVEVPEFELWVQCHRCRKEAFFYGERKVDAIQVMRNSSWAFDELNESGMCPECLDEH